nr:hypothetical protein [Clostridium sp. Marseille-P7770]
MELVLISTEIKLENGVAKIGNHKGETMLKTLKEMLIEAGYSEGEMDHHESDLYVYITPLTTKVIEEWCKAHDYRMAWHCPIFKDQITGRMMYDCAFQWYEN